MMKYAPKACDHCGKLHICTGTVHCPCFDVIVSEAVLEYIAVHFDECLCNDCIENLMNKACINYESQYVAIVKIQV